MTTAKAMQSPPLSQPGFAPAPPPPPAARAYDKMAYQAIYPQYIDSYLTPREGRRLTKLQAVEHPTLEEMAFALRLLGYQTVIVDPQRSYPRSQSTTKFPMVPRGCIRVAIKDPLDEHYIKKSEFDTQTRNATVADIASKQELLRRVAALIKEKAPNRPQLATVEDAINAYLPSPQPKGRK